MQCVCWQRQRHYGDKWYRSRRRQRRILRDEQPDPRRQFRLVLPASVRVHVRHLSAGRHRPLCRRLRRGPASAKSTPETT